MSPIPLALVAFLLSSLTIVVESDDDAPFVRAIAAVAAERYAEMARHLAEARAIAPDATTLQADCVSLAGLPPDAAGRLLQLIQTRDSDSEQEIDVAIRGLLVRTLGAEARRQSLTAAVDDARRAADTAVAFAVRFDEPALERSALLDRATVLLDCGPRTSDIARVAADVAAARALDTSGATARRRALLEARRHRAMGDDLGALTLLAEFDVDADEGGVAFDLLRLRGTVAARAGRFDVAAVDAAGLERHLAETDDASERSRAAFALATIERLRPARADESAGARFDAAEALYDRAVGEASTSLDRATALEWRGSVRSFRGRHRAAEEDFGRAEELYTAVGRSGLAGRLRMRAAWNAFHAGDTVESRRTLTRFEDGLDALALHSTARLGERRNANHLRTRIAIAEDDLVAAEAAVDALCRIDRSLTEPLGRRDILLTHHRRGAIFGSIVRDLLALTERHPDARARAFELASACAEHGRVLLLAKLIAGPDRPTFGLRAGSLPPLPDGVAEVRWTTTTEDASAPSRTLILARFGDRLVFEAIDQADRLDAAIEAFLEEWMRPESLPRPAEEYATESHALFRKLFGSASSWFTPGAAPRRVVVIAEGVIERLPLEALVIAAPRRSASYAELPWLVHESATVHVPSLGVLAALDAPNDRNAAVAVIDPIVRDEDGRPLPSLRSTSLERDALAHDRDVETLRRERATLPRLLAALSLREIGWLHLGSHAVPDDVLHDRASLFLTTNAQTPSNLGVTQVITLPLTPGVRVVLSACATASGVLLPGEGVQALWRAFLVARASCVLSTLRAVDDRSAGHWMREFHLAAGAGLPLAEAAQRASQRWLTGASRPAFPRGHAVADPCHPYLWAAWVCVGHDGGALPLPR